MQKKTTFESAGIVIFAISMLSSGLNYLFQILCGRLLNAADYGQINALFSIINILVVAGSALGLSITKHIAESEKDYGGSVKGIFKQMIWIAPLFIAVSTAIICLLVGADFYTSFIASISTYATALAFIFYSVLQGKKQFLKVGVYNIIQPAFKFVCGIALLWIGLSYHSVLYTLSVGALIAMLYGYINAKKEINFLLKPESSDIKNVYKYFIFTFISTVCLTIFNNFDVLIIKNFFDETTTGLYSSASLFGKIILYIPVAFVTMMVPMVAESKTTDEAIKTLKKTLFYSIGVSGIACAGLFILRNFIIKLLMGEKFLPATEYILPVCIMMLMLVCVTVFVNFLIVKNDKWFTTISCIIAIITSVVLSIIFHKEVVQIICMLSTVYGLLVFALLTRIIKNTKRRI